MKHVFLVLTVLLCTTLSGAVVTALPGGTVEAMPEVNYQGAGPQVFDGGITWTSGNGSAVFGYTGTYGFNTNGQWTGTLGPMAGTNSPTQSMTFAFTSPVDAVGGFLNWAPGQGTAMMAVYDSSSNLLESYTLTFTTTGAADTGAFYGFTSSTANISYFTLSGAYVGLTDLTVGGSEVPEPASYALVGISLAGLALLRRKRRA